MIYISDIYLRYLKPCERKTPGQRYQVCQDILVKDGLSQWFIPAGWSTDGASIPRFLWWWISPFNGDYIEAAIVHDYLYMKKPVSRKRADAMFYTIMRQSGVPVLRAWLMFKAVDLFGFAAWRE